MTSNGTIKLGDFGISKQLFNTCDQAMTHIGTPYYMSPEVCRQEPYSFKSDIWALGVILYEFCALEKPFKGQNLWSLVFMIAKGKFSSIPQRYSQDL